jgi:hypothetical protein
MENYRVLFECWDKRRVMIILNMGQLSMGERNRREHYPAIRMPHGGFLHKERCTTIEKE